MAEYRCQRCGETNPHGLSGGMCSPCCAELQRLTVGDPVEWLHPKGSWRPATFIEFNHRGGTAKLQTPVGCEVYRKQILLRVPEGRVIVPRRGDK